MNKDLDKLIDKLPFFLQNELKSYLTYNTLIEIILDLGRKPEARFSDGPQYISQKLISWQDLEYITKRLSRFSSENRTGIERTLYRISCIRNRQFLINGLTCRIGRTIFGTISVIRDLLETNQSILILGKPGIGKTTIIREIARILADEIEKRVIIVDTSNEIAGESDIPHFAIGRARRMQVPKTELQHQVMIEAIENHMPEIIIIDEIGTELEVLAAQTIAEKGVQLVGTTHGSFLINIIKTPLLSHLIGGIHQVTLSDDEAKRRKTQKTILERKSYPTFEIVIELNKQHSWTIHEDVQISIDLILHGNFIIEQIREFFIAQKINIKSNCIHSNSGSFLTPYNKFKSQNLNFVIRNRNHNLIPIKSQVLSIYIYSLSYNLLREIICKINCNFIITTDILNASLIIGLKNHFQKSLKLKYFVKIKKIPVYLLTNINISELNKLINEVKKTFF